MNAITRKEVFLDAAAGNEQTLPEPITREEVFLKAIVDAQSGGGGGSSGSGVLVVGMDASTMALDKTWQEIFEADVAVIVIQGGIKSKTKLFVSSVVNIIADKPYIVYAVYGSNNSVICYTFSTESANGFPVFQPPMPSTRAN